MVVRFTTAQKYINFYSLMMVFKGVWSLVVGVVVSILDMTWPLTWYAIMHCYDANAIYQHLEKFDREKKIKVYGKI